MPNLEGLKRYQEERKKTLSERDIKILKAIAETKASIFDSTLNIPELKALNITSYDEIQSLTWRGYLTAGIGVTRAQLTQKGRQAIKGDIRNGKTY